MKRLNIESVVCFRLWMPSSYYYLECPQCSSLLMSWGWNIVMQWWALVTGLLCCGCWLSSVGWLTGYSVPGAPPLAFLIFTLPGIFLSSWPLILHVCFLLIFRQRRTQVAQLQFSGISWLVLHGIYLLLIQVLPMEQFPAWGAFCRAWPSAQAWLQGGEW